MVSYDILSTEKLLVVIFIKPKVRRLIFLIDSINYSIVPLGSSICVRFLSTNL